MNATRKSERNYRNWIFTGNEKTAQNSKSKNFLGILRGISWITGKTAKPKGLI